MKKIITIFTAALMFAAGAHAQPFTVVGVSDGDTITVLSESRQQVKCRLYGIDAPEKSQAFGQASKQSLSDLVYRRVVDVQVLDTDRYGRSICRIHAEGRDVNREQVARGMAWMYRRYTSDTAYAQAEDAARAKRLGLWQDANPVPPWDYRSANRDRDGR